MSTIGKALSLLDTVSRLERDTGLSEIARFCELDKATARRLLVELQAHGFIEQDPETRRYSIGAAPIRLARIREIRFPLVRIARPILKALAQDSGETVHLSKFAGGKLSTIHVEESPHAHRVIVAIGTLLHLHATASGLAFLASCTVAEVDAILASPLQRFTEDTVTDPEALRMRLRETVARGFSISSQGLELGVISTAAAIHAPGGLPIGSVAIAAPASRADMTRMMELGARAVRSAAQIASIYYGTKMSEGIQPIEGGLSDGSANGIAKHSGHRDR